MRTAAPASQPRVRPSDLAIELDELELLAAPSPDTLPAARMRLVLVRALGSLASALASHFAFEEQGGYMREALTANPGLARKVQALRGQHAALTERVRQLLGRCKRAGLEALQRELAELVTDVRAHEQAERELFESALDDDIGVAD